MPWYEGIGSTNYKGYRPAEMDAQQLINQGLSSPNAGNFAPEPRGVPSMRAPSFSGQVGFTAPGALNSQAFGRVASANYGNLSRAFGQQDAMAIRPNEYEAGVLARSGLQWNPAAGRAERVGVQAPMMAARPGVAAPAAPPRGMISGVSDEEAAARRERLASRRVPTAPLDWAGSSYEPRTAMRPAPAPPMGGGGERTGLDPRAQAVQAAMQAFAESAGRYGGAGRGMVNLAGVEAGQAYDQRQLQSQQLQQANELEQQKIAMMGKEVEARRAGQIPVAAQIELAGIQAGLSPIEARAFGVRYAPAPGIGVRQPGAPAPIGIQPPAAPASPVDSKIALMNQAPDLMSAINPKEDVESTLLGLADRGFRASDYPPELVDALRQEIVSTYGMNDISAAVSSPHGSGGLPTEMLGNVGPEMASMWKPFRIALQPANYMLGGSGTSPFGDPVTQVKNRVRLMELWKSLGGQIPGAAAP